MSGFESTIENCTSEKRTDEDWGLILDICERVEKTPSGSTDSLRCVVKRLKHRIPHVAMSALTLLDAMVKNCGKPFRREMSSREFVGEAKSILNNKNTHPKVAQRFRFLIKKWAENEFKGDSDLNLFVSGLYQQLVRDGAKFDYSEDAAYAAYTSPKAKTTDDSRRKALVQEEEDLAKAIALSLSEDQKKGGRAGAKSSGPASGAGGGSGAGLYPSSSLFSATPAATGASAGATTAEPGKEPRKVRALYDFEAVEDNELTFKAGEIILVSDDSDANWWKGSNHRGEGLFPATFVSSDLNAKPDVVEAGGGGGGKAVSFNEEVAVVEGQQAAAGGGAEMEPVTIDEACIDNCLVLLENADPTGEMKPDPPELLPLESRCRQMAPLIDAELERIDRRHNTLAEMNVRLMEALQLYNQLMGGASAAQTLPGSMGLMGMKMEPGMVAPPGMVGAMQPPPPPPMAQPPGGMMYAPGGQAMYDYLPPGNQNNSNSVAMESQAPAHPPPQNGLMSHPHPVPPQSYYPTPGHSQFVPSMPPQAIGGLVGHSLQAQAPPSQSPLL